MRYFIEIQGRDTIITFTYGNLSENVECRYIRVNLNYLSGVSENDDPEFKCANSSEEPFLIYINKNN